MSAVAHQEIRGQARPSRRRSGLLGRVLPSSVRGLVIAGFGLLVVVLGCVTLGASWQVRQHQADLSELEHHSTEASLLQTAEAQAGIAALALQRYVSTGSDSNVAEINLHADNAQASLEAALAAGGPAGLDKVVSAGSTLVLQASRAAQLREQGDVADASAVLEEIVPIFIRVPAPAGNARRPGAGPGAASCAPGPTGRAISPSGFSFRRAPLASRWDSPHPSGSRGRSSSRSDRSRRRRAALPKATSRRERPWTAPRVRAPGHPC